MLIMSGKPIKNCYDFFHYYNAADALRNPAELVAFARGNLEFNKINKACIELLAIALDEEKHISLKSPKEFWQVSPLPDVVPAKIIGLIDEGFLSFNKKEEGWERKFLSRYALAILADKSPNFQEISPEDSSNNQSVDLEKSNIKVIPGQKYFCKRKAGKDFPAGETIKTVCVSASWGYTGSAVLNIGSEALRIASGKTVYLNVINKEVVNILPMETVDEKFKRGEVMQNGFKIPGNASSFVIDDDVVYSICDGRLKVVGRNFSFIPLLVFNFSCVEIAKDSKSIYLLTDEGEVIDIFRGVKPKEVANKRFLMLKDAIEAVKSSENSDGGGKLTV